MLNLTIDDIKDFTNDIIFRRGYKVFKSNKIKDFKVKELKDNGELVYNISAYIMGSSSNDKYYTEFFISELGITKYYCSCPAFFNYDGPCKHITALLIAFHYNPNEIFKMQKRQTIDKLITNIQSGSKNLTIPKCELLMDLTLCVENSLDRPRISLELKIGEMQKYVVKNMKNFIYSIMHKEELQFGVNFTLKNTYHYFSEDDMKIVNIIEELYEFNEISENQSDYNYKSFLFKGKKVYLPQSHSKRILEILKGRSFNVKYLDSENSNVEILYEDLPLEFMVNHIENDIVIKQINDLPVAFTEDREYFLYNGAIYKPSKTQIELYRGFFNSLQEEKEIIINKSYIKDMGKFIIPAIKNISKKVSIDSKLKNNFIEEPLKSEIYFDKINNTITSTLYFNYGDLKINPLQDNEKDDTKVAIRDLTNESRIIELLKQYGFEENTKEYCIKDEDTLLTFLSEGMDELQKECEIYYSNSFKNIKIYSSSYVKTSLRINDENLLEFSFNIEGMDNKELKSVFDAVKLKKNYYRLNNGGFVLLNALGIRELAETIEYLDIKSKDIGKEFITLPKYNALYLDGKLSNANDLSIERNEKFCETISKFRKINESDFRVPDDLNTILRDYQKIGFKWFRSLEEFGFGGILADEMGLGKTLQAASFISSKIDEDKNNIFMVICPTSLIYNWESEFEKFTPDLKTTVISGAKDVRERKIGDIKDTNVLITSYPLIRNDLDLYKDITFTACFIDEAQNIKNPSSLSAKAVKSINSKVNFAITGTPLENSLTELWSIFDFIMPGYLLNHSKFLKIYEKPIIKKSEENALKELNRHIKPFILRRLKRDVALELPPKIEHKLIVDLSEEQKKLYVSYVAACKKEIDEEISKNGFNKSKIKILSAITRLRQICCEPSIFIEDFKGKSAKMEALLEIIENSIKQKHRILIFSQFTSALKVIQKNLNKNNIEHLYLDGQTKSENRITLVKEFNEGYGDIFLISLKAGGTGLNLTGADTVIHYDPWWNPAVEDQASDRAHRIGQKKTVEVIKIITKGTIEEKIFELQEKKKEIFNNVMNGASEQNFISKMNEEDLKDLFM